MATIISERRVSQGKLKESLEKIKSSIQDAYKFCEDNYDRFNKFTTAITKSSYSEIQRNALVNLGKPIIECNIMEPTVNRLLGEFLKQEPSINVGAKNSNRESNVELQKILGGYLRALLTDADQNNFQMDVIANQLRGGWGIIKVFTEYQHELSFEQDFILKSLDPLQCYFDPTAELIHKADAHFAGEFFIMTVEEFESKYGTKYTQNFSWESTTMQMNQGIRWSYEGDFGARYVLLAHHYEKKCRKQKIMELLTGQVVTESEYNDIQDAWVKMGRIEQPPGIIGKPRIADVMEVVRYTLIEKDILEYVETEDRHIPLVWADGNSAKLRRGKGEAPEQFTKPYPYHLLGMQQAKNFALSTWVNDVENMSQSKIIAAKEAIPAEYIDAYTYPQKAMSYIYNQFKDNDPNVRIDRPEPFPRVPLPPEVIQLFQAADQASQLVLGNYDMNTINGQISGEAIQQGSMQSNAAAMPYTNGLIQALTQACKIILDKAPRLHTRARTIPVKGLNGKMTEVAINQDGAPSFKFDRNEFNVRVSAGVNFEVQKARSMEMIGMLMKASPDLAQFFGNTTPGVETLLDNVDIRNIDALKQSVEQFMQQNQQKQQQAQQMQMQQAQAPLMIKQAELQQSAQKIQQDMEVKNRQLDIQEVDADTRRMVGLATIGEKADKTEMEQMKLEAEEARTQVASVNAVANIADVSHKHAMDIMKVHQGNEHLHAKLAHELQKAQIKEVAPIAASVPEVVESKPKRGRPSKKG